MPQRLRAEAESHQPFFSTLETDLGKAKDVNERMVRGHSERDVDLERYRERVQQLLERWQAVLGQADLRQRELDQLGRQLRYYRQSCDALRQWIRDARQRQEAIQAVPITDSQAVRQQLLQEKVPGRVLGIPSGQGGAPGHPQWSRGAPGYPQWGKEGFWVSPVGQWGLLVILSGARRASGHPQWGNGGSWASSVGKEDSWAFTRRVRGAPSHPLSIPSGARGAPGHP